MYGPLSPLTIFARNFKISGSRPRSEAVGPKFSIEMVDDQHTEMNFQRLEIRSKDA